MSDLNLNIDRGSPKVGVHIRVKPDTHGKIEAIAKSEDVPVAVVYRAIIDFYFAQSSTERTQNMQRDVVTHQEPA